MILYRNGWMDPETVAQFTCHLEVFFKQNICVVIKEKWLWKYLELIWILDGINSFSCYQMSLQRFWFQHTPVTKRTLPLLNVLSMRHIFSSRYWSKYSYEQQMKIFWWGLFDLAFSRTKWHSLPRPIYAWVGTPSPFPKPSQVWNKCWKLSATCTS